MKEKSRETVAAMMKEQGKQPMPMNGAQSIRIHRSILEMMAMHNRPYTIVEDVEIHV